MHSSSFLRRAAPTCFKSLHASTLNDRTTIHGQLALASASRQRGGTPQHASADMDSPVNVRAWEDVDISRLAQAAWAIEFEGREVIG